MTSNTNQKPQRIDSKYIIFEIEYVLHFYRGILIDIKKILLRPGDCVCKFITEDSTRLVKPNPLGAIIKNVSSSIFCVVKRNKKCLSATGRYREPFLMKFFLFSIRFSIKNHSNCR